MGELASAPFVPGPEHQARHCLDQQQPCQPNDVSVLSLCKATALASFLAHSRLTGVSFSGDQAYGGQSQWALGSLEAALRFSSGLLRKFFMAQDDVSWHP